MRLLLSPRAVAGVVLWALAACTAMPSPRPGALTGVPDRGREVDRMLEFARDRLDRGDAVEALAVATAVIAEDGDHVDAHRLRQDILRERGRKGLLVHEAEARMARAPSAAAHYLRGRLAPAGAPQQAHFARAVDLDPTFFFGWIGLASSLRRSDPERALSIYQDLYAAAPGPLTAINLANSLIDLGRPAEAAKVYAALRDRDGLVGVADLGMARALVLQDERTAAWPLLLSAVRERPYDGGVRTLLERFVLAGLPQDRLEQVRDVLYQEPGRLQAFVNAGGAPLLAEVFSRLGSPQAARELLARDGQPPRDPRQRRQWRRSALALGEVATFLADLRQTMPEFLLQDERNQLRGRWVALLHGAFAEAQDPLADPEQVLDLVAALREVGLLAEADVVATHGIVRAGSAPGAAALRQARDEIRRLLGFEAAVKTVMYAGYAAAGPRTLAQVFAELKAKSLEIFGADVVGSPRVFRIPFVGELVDPFGPGLPEHFAGYNKHLVLGQRRGMPVEALLLTRLSLCDLEEDADVPVPVRAREIVGEDRTIHARTSLIGGDIAGVALIDNFVVDMDAVRDWASALLRLRRIGRQDGLALLADPLPAGAEPLDPLDAEWRLSLLSPEQDSDLDGAVLDVIRWHERAHLSDTFHFLPPEANLWRILGLLLHNGLRATAVEANLEARAELAALAKSSHTRLVLAHIAGFCGQQLDGFSPHASGFERLAGMLQRRLIAMGCGESEVAVSRWHELDPEHVRQAARALLAQLW